MATLHLSGTGIFRTLPVVAVALAIAPSAGKCQDFWNLDVESVGGGVVWRVRTAPNERIYALSDGGLFVSEPLPGHELERRVFGWNSVSKGSITDFSEVSDTLLISDYNTGLQRLIRDKSTNRFLENIGVQSTLAISGTYYAGGLGGQLFVSSDGGTTWSIDNLDRLPLSDEPITQILPVQSAVVYRQGNYLVQKEGGHWNAYEMSYEGIPIGYNKLRLIDGRLYTFQERSIYESIDGKSWTRFAYEPFIWPIQDFIINGDVILIAAWTDIFLHSKDGGQTWSYMTDLLGEEDPHRRDLAVDEHGFAYLAASAYVYRTVLPLDDASGIARQAVTDVPSASTLTSVFPNPIHGTAQVEYVLERPGDVDIGVFDMVGRKVQTVERGFRPAGASAVRWTPNLPSGVYLVRLITEDTRSHVLVTVVH